MQYKVYYTFTANDNGGFTEIDVDPIDDMGEITIFALGPLGDGCPQYTGGFFADCVSAEDPGPIFFNMGPNSTYMIGVMSNVEGAFNLFSTPLTVSLPVEMIDYHISVKGDEAIIEWSTAQEYNNAGFEIYKSLGDSDFEKIGFVEPVLQQRNVNQYNYTDSHTGGEEIAYYYIKQIDIDGNATDFDILTATFERHIALTSSPNPSNNYISIYNNDYDGPANVRMVDTYGQLLINTDTYLPYDLDVSELIPGVYYIQVEIASSIYTLKQIVL